MEIEGLASSENTVDEKMESSQSLETKVEYDTTFAEDNVKNESEGIEPDEASGNKESTSNDVDSKEVTEEDDSGNKESKDKISDSEWDKNILFVSGIPPGKAGNLKKLLNTTLEANCHRIMPTLKGESNLHVTFRSYDEMKVAESLLHNQKFIKYKLTAKVVDGPMPQKRPASREKEDESSAKKVKHDILPGQQFLERPYEDQISYKTEDVQMKLHKVAKVLQGNYPKYDGLIFHRQLKHDGLLCTLAEFKKCPPDHCFASRCKFAIGVDEETEQPAVGIRVARGDAPAPRVKDISTVNHNYPQHVVDAAKVFEKAVQASEKAPGKAKFWHELIIQTNIAQDLMFLVFVHCKQDSAADELKSLNEELKDFFENGEGKDCRLVALFTKAICTDVARPLQQRWVMELVMGEMYLEETVMDFKIHLLPMMYFWNSPTAAKMVCEGIEELLSPTKSISILEIGCGIGLIGFYLSKLAGEVLSMDSEDMIAEAKMNAERNEITNVQHFCGKAEEMIPEMAKKIQFDKACAIVISSGNRFSTCPKAMDELRKIEQLKRIVLVAESTSGFNPITLLGKTKPVAGLGNPFFPVKAIPIDTMPNLKSYILLVLMERIGLVGLPKTVKILEPSRLKMKDGRYGYSKKKDRDMFFRKRGGKQWRGQKGRFQYSPYNQRQMGYNNYGSNLYQLQHMLAEERQRRMEVEEQKRWLQEQQRRRQVDDRKHNNPVQDLISDSLKEAGVPQLNSDTSEKLKQVIAEAIKNAGVLGQEQQQTDTTATDNSNAAAYGGTNWNQTLAGRAYHANYGGASASGYGQPDANAGNMYGRQNWNTGQPVQYPQYGQGKAQYGSWQGASGYATYDTSNTNQRGGYRNMNQGKRYFS